MNYIIYCIIFALFLQGILNTDNYCPIEHKYTENASCMSSVAENTTQ